MLLFRECIRYCKQAGKYAVMRKAGDVYKQQSGTIALDFTLSQVIRHIAVLEFFYQVRKRLPSIPGGIPKNSGHPPDIHLV